MVWTKSDIHGHTHKNSRGNLHVSAHTRVGLLELIREIENTLDTTYGSLDPELPLLTRARHQAALSEAAQELAAFQEIRLSQSVPVSIAAVHLRSAVHALETLIGAVDVDDVLTKVFTTFCVGK
jgi:tRNA modification GTPase